MHIPQLIAQERRVSFELENIPKTDTAALEEFVAKYSAVLNPRHGLVVSAKQGPNSIDKNLA